MFLFAASLGLRLRGIGFGLPLLSNYYVRPDETLLVIPAAELPVRLGNPGHLNYPALLMEVYAVLFRGVHWLLATGGSAFANFLDDVGANPSRYFLTGRVVSACCGAALAVLVYAIARRFASPLCAAVAAAWYAVSPLAVREAHFAVTDTPMSLLVGAGLLAAVRVFETPPAGRRRAIVVCGCLAGAAVATKYSAAVVVPVLAFALLWPWRARRPAARVSDAWLFLAVSAGTFAVLNPWLLLHPGDLLDWMRELFRGIYRERPELVTDPGVARGWTRAMDYAGLMPGRFVGVACAVAGVIVALVRCLRSGDGRLVAVLGVALGFIAMFAPARTLPFRYLAPLLPLAAVLAAMALDAWRGTSSFRWRAGLVAVVGIAGVAMTAPATLHLVNSLAREDSRSEAGRWIRANVPASVPIVWLGAPESEAQILETPASLHRRIEYVERKYGPVAARVIDRVYLLALRAPAAGAYDVYRNPQPQDVAPRLVCVIQAAYPSPTVVTDPRLWSRWTQGRIVRSHDVGRPLPAGRQLLEPWDAFYLPLNPERPLQPGPRFQIVLVERDARP